jgi:hypothetical protein
MSRSAKALLMLIAFIVGACATSSRSRGSEPEHRKIRDFAVLHEGHALVVMVSYLEAARSIGDERMVLAVEVTGVRGAGPVLLKRDKISLRTPPGDRIPLITQSELRGLYPGIRFLVERALFDLPLLDRLFPGRLACDEWFLADPSWRGIALDEIPVGSLEVCSGPLVFFVPGGIQPGRWRLVIGLEETQVSIPFRIPTE